MKLLSWNVRGLGNPRAFRALRDLVRSENPQVLFLIETKLDSSSSNRIRIGLGFDSCFTVDRVGGDFNEILRDNEKSGGLVRSFRAMAQFRDTVDGCNLIDLGFRGSRFTWNNRHSAGDLIEERLDRFLYHWGSDHKPILIDGVVKGNRGSNQNCGWGSCFHYKDAWANDDECKAIVDAEWKAGFGASAISSLLNIVGLVSAKLISWNRLKKKSCDKDLKNLKEELQFLYGAGEGRLDVSRIKQIESSIDELLVQKELFWRQRSRALWLHASDKNTKFFHTKATQRKRRNRISGLMDLNGVWKEEAADLENLISGFYNQLLQSNNPSLSNVQEVIQAVECKVTDHMNKFLMSRFTADDVSTALKQMAPSKAPGLDGFPAGFY
ncbi:hypothetical protein ACOSP7_027831 [Xanthoceras sorbifolium]